MGFICEQGHWLSTGYPLLAASAIAKLESAGIEYGPQDQTFDWAGGWHWIGGGHIGMDVGGW